MSRFRSLTFGLSLSIFFALLLSPSVSIGTFFSFHIGIIKSTYLMCTLLRKVFSRTLVIFSVTFPVSHSFMKLCSCRFGFFCNVVCTRRMPTFFQFKVLVLIGKRLLSLSLALFPSLSFSITLSLSLCCRLLPKFTQFCCYYFSGTHRIF